MRRTRLLAALLQQGRVARPPVVHGSASRSFSAPPSPSRLEFLAAAAFKQRDSAESLRPVLLEALQAFDPSASEKAPDDGKGNDKASRLVRAYGLAMITSCARKEFHLVEPFFEDMTQHGLHPDLRCLNAAMRASLALGRPEQVVVLYQSLAERGLSGDQHSFTMVITAAGSLGDVRSAADAMEESAVSSAAAVLGSGSGVRRGKGGGGGLVSPGGQPTSALVLSLVAAMERAGASSSASYVVAMGILGSLSPERHWRDVVDLLDRMPQHKVPLNVIACNAALTVCGRAGQWRPALDILQRMDPTSDLTQILAHAGLDPEVGVDFGGASAAEDGKQTRRPSGKTRQGSRQAARYGSKRSLRPNTVSFLQALNALFQGAK